MKTNSLNYLNQFSFANSVLLKSTAYYSKLTLNKPKQLNSLDEEILLDLKTKIRALKDSNQKVLFTYQQIKKLVVLAGTGKGFCGGGNIKLYYQLLDMPKEIGLTLALDQLKMQYQTLNELNQIKPSLMSIWNGIVMGGGVGMSLYNQIKVATENAQFAMPEVNLGLFVDNSATYYFPKLPYNFGKFLATTGTTVKGKDLVKLGLADYYIKSDNLGKLEESLDNQIDQNSSIESIKQIVQSHAETKQGEPFVIPEEWKQIEKLFNFSNFAQFYKNLTTNIDTYKQNILDKCIDASPLSMQVAFRMVEEAKYLKSQEEAFDRDCRLFQIMTRKNDDFKEGIKQILSKRKYQAKYQYKKMKDVPKEAVDQIFKDIKKQIPLYP